VIGGHWMKLPEFLRWEFLDVLLWNDLSSPMNLKVKPKGNLLNSSA
jgi:hypothetical protein